MFLIFEYIVVKLTKAHSKHARNENGSESSVIYNCLWTYPHPTWNILRTHQVAQWKRLEYLLWIYTFIRIGSLVTILFCAAKCEKVEEHKDIGSANTLENHLIRGTSEFRLYFISFCVEEGLLSRRNHIFRISIPIQIDVLGAFISAEDVTLLFE